MKTTYGKLAVLAASAFMLSVSAGIAENSDDGDYSHKPEAQDFIHGAPENPSIAWTLAAGGRIYDNWWNALDRDEPQTTNPAYPSEAMKSGSSTWRCKECHGWDYLGQNGVYSKGSHFTGIDGIKGAIGRPVDDLIGLLRDKNHPYSTDMINDDEMARVALFVSQGQIDMASFIDLDTRTMIAGDPDKGRAVFQTVCAACHGYDGRMIDWGDGDTHNYVGTEASHLADEVLHKVLSAHPGVAMANLRAFPIEVAINVMAYAATLPTE